MMMMMFNSVAAEACLSLALISSASSFRILGSKINTVAIDILCSRQAYALCMEMTFKREND